MTEDLWRSLLEPALLANTTQRIISVEHKEPLERTFAALLADVDAIARRLLSAGVGPGQPVGIVGPNCLAWIATDLAVLKIGAHSVGLQTVGGQHHRATALRAVVSVSPHIGSCENTPLLSEQSWNLELAATWESLPAGTQSVAFSSGTTGTSKGLLLTAEGIRRAIDVSRTAWQVSREDAIFVVLPLSSFQQRLLCYVAICSGAAAHLVPPERMYQMMTRLEPTIVLGPPSFFELIPRVPSWRSIYGQRARLLLTGSAPVPPALIAYAESNDVPLFEVYGSTEFGWISMNLPGIAKPGTSGRLVPGVRLRFGAEGEIQVSSPANQAFGYIWDQHVSEPEVFLADGWINTGDIGELDKNGYLCLSGRKKNVLITRSGVKIAPEPIERHFVDHPDVSASMAFLSANGARVQLAIWVNQPSGSIQQELELLCLSVNAKLPDHSKVRGIEIRNAEELSSESGVLTRNRKLNRTRALQLLQGKESRMLSNQHE
ncbi:AMP-binding protein [Mycobacteroides abscessus]|uniref:AMP-binding protein n=1 Tax=Mycobacteroides abscessus TaxID=36809 RepID=UPI00094C1C15|nr:AMP-binding protein [Mycobacteroides abscessus]